MGCQVWADHKDGPQINYTVGSWLAVDMVRHFVPDACEYDSDGYYLMGITSQGVKQADIIVHSDYYKFLMFQSAKSEYKGHRFTEEDFHTARNFIKQCAALECGFSVSH